MKNNIIVKTCAITTAIGLMYFQVQYISTSINTDFDEVVEPQILLADGKIMSLKDITAIEFDKYTAIENIELFFEEDETPEYNDYLSIFTCPGCNKNCLLINPSCVTGKQNAVKATEVYIQAFPEVQI